MYRLSLAEPFERAEIVSIMCMLLRTCYHFWEALILCNRGTQKRCFLCKWQDLVEMAAAVVVLIVNCLQGSDS